VPFHAFLCSWAGIKVILSYIGIELVLMKAAPGYWHHGPVAPSGHVPLYLDNAFQHMCMAIAIFIGGAQAGLWSLAVFVEHYRDLAMFMNLGSLAFCVLLYFKGILAPSTPDNSTTGNFLVDFYWGTELYPRIFGWDVKQFTNCRFGMMFWTLFPISAAAYNMQITGALQPECFVNAVLNVLYCAKFFWWEVKGYMHTMGKRAPAPLGPRARQCHTACFHRHPTRPRWLLHLLGLPRMDPHFLHDALRLLGLQRRQQWHGLDHSLDLCYPGHSLHHHQLRSRCAAPGGP